MKYLIFMMGLLSTLNFYDGEDDDYEWVCPEEQYATRKEQLKTIYESDQLSRIEYNFKSMKQDLSHRIDVATIFAEGCLKSGEDFYIAALIFQHGTKPEHYYQAWIWANEAKLRGESKATWLIPRAIDRYLQSKNFQQIYGTAIHGEIASSTSIKWCLWPVASIVSDDERVSLKLKTLKEQLTYISQKNKDASIAIEASYCKNKLKPPPQDIVIKSVSGNTPNN